MFQVRCINSLFQLLPSTSYRRSSPPNSTPRRFPSCLLLILLLTFLFILYLPRCTLHDFYQFLPWLLCHFYLVVITTTTLPCYIKEKKINHLTHRKQGHLTSKLNSETVPVLPSVYPSLTYPFHHSPSPVHLTGFSYCFFPRFYAIFTSNTKQQHALLNLFSIIIIPYLQCISH